MCVDATLSVRDRVRNSTQQAFWLDEPEAVELGVADGQPCTPYFCASSSSQNGLRVKPT